METLSLTCQWQGQFHHQMPELSAASSPSESSSYSENEDLLPDLWLESPQLAEKGTSLMLRESSLEYAQSLLPHNLLFQDIGWLLPVNVPVTKQEPHKSKSRKSSVLSDSTTGSSSSSGSCSRHKHINTNLYKTELCVSHMKIGTCPYGSKCQFAHGENELKQVERPANWRSKPCVNWAKYGSCRYGKRCCFIHGN